MNPPTLNRRQSQELDRRAQDQFGVVGLVLMENAGRGVTDKIIQLGLPPPVVICCGRGNNAGDGFVIARHLDIRGVEAKVLLWADPGDLRGDAAANYEILARCDVPIEIFAAGHDPQRLDACLRGAGTLVDALLGTGARGEPRAPFDSVIDAINEHPAPVLAVDLPSGLDCDTGEAARHTVRAAETCTFVALKPGLLAPGAAAFTGRIHVLDIGAPRKLVDQMLAANQGL